jgi:hypothetical protein
VRLTVRTGAAAVTVVRATDATKTAALALDPGLGVFAGSLAAVTPFEDAPPLGAFTIRLSERTLDDLWIAVRWGSNELYQRGGEWPLRLCSRMPPNRMAQMSARDFIEQNAMYVGWSLQWLQEYWASYNRMVVVLISERGEPQHSNGSATVGNSTGRLVPKIVPQIVA